MAVAGQAIDGHIISSAQQGPPAEQAPLQELAASQDAASQDPALASVEPHVMAEPQAPAVHCVATGSMPGMNDKYSTKSGLTVIAPYAAAEPRTAVANKPRIALVNRLVGARLTTASPSSRFSNASFGFKVLIACPNRV